MFKRLVATSRAPQIMVLSMLRSFGKIGPQIDQIWAWLSRGHPSKVRSRALVCWSTAISKSSFKIIRVNPPPPPPPPPPLNLAVNNSLRFLNFDLDEIFLKNCTSVAPKSKIEVYYRVNNHESCLVDDINDILPGSDKGKTYQRTQIISKIEERRNVMSLYFLYLHQPTISIKLSSKTKVYKNMKYIQINIKIYEN